MKKINDHYFAAWLIVVKKCDYETKIINTKDDFKNIFVKISNEEYFNLQKEYKDTVKCVFSRVRKFVKELSLNNK